MGTNRQLLETLNVKEHLPDHPISYVTQILTLPEVYGVRATLFNGQFTLHVLQARSFRTTTFAGEYTEGQELFEYVAENKDYISGSIDGTVDVYSSGSSYQSIRITKHVRVSHDRLLDTGGTTQEVIDLISNAYRNGVNILISGVTGAGKTSFINALIDASDDNVPTVVVAPFEMIYSDETKNVVEIFGESGNLLQAALTVGHHRIVIDDCPRSGEMNELFLNHRDRQYIATTHFAPVPMATGEEDHSEITRFADGHSFQLRVDLGITPAPTEANPYAVTHSIAAVHEIVASYDSYKLHTIYSGTEFVQEPTEALASRLDSEPANVITPELIKKLEARESSDD
jgi:hypothetical protein